MVRQRTYGSVIRDCDQNFAEIGGDITAMRAVREGKIQMNDLGGVFTISNGGIYGSMLSTIITTHNLPFSDYTLLLNVPSSLMARSARPMMYLAFAKIIA